MGDSGFEGHRREARAPLYGLFGTPNKKMPCNFCWVRPSIAGRAGVRGGDALTVSLLSAREPPR